MDIPTAPEVLVNHPDVLVQTLTWAVVVLLALLAIVSVACYQTVRWLITRCDTHTGLAWGKVDALTGVIHQNNVLEQRRQDRYLGKTGAGG